MGQAAGQRAIAEWVSSERPIRDLAAFLRASFPTATSILVFGGALRDRLIGVAGPPRDIDVVLGGVTTESLDGLQDARRNFFGGAKLAFGGLTIDIWPLSETHHIKSFQLAPTIDNLLAGAPFNLEKIVYDLLTGVLHDRGCIAGIEQRRIVYAPARPYHERIQAVRCVLLRSRTGFSLDPSARELLARVSAGLHADESELEQMRRYLVAVEQVYGEGVGERVLGEILRVHG